MRHLSNWHISWFVQPQDLRSLLSGTQRWCELSCTVPVLDVN